MTYTTLLELIKSRQSLYPAQMESNAIIPRTDLLKLLELANYAPTHRRTEPWRYIVFEKQKLQELYLKLGNIYKNISFSDYHPAKHEKIIDKHLSFSHVIAICMKRDEKESVPSFEEEYSVACSVQNMLLGMKSLNIIGYWSSPKMCYTQEMKDYLGLSVKDKCLGLLQLGVPRADLPTIPKKQMSDIGEKVRWF